MSDVTCFKHPKYKGDTPPDLSCKVCCSKFVNRIRAEQSAKFEELQKVGKQDSFKPMGNRPAMAENASPNFDASWI